MSKPEELSISELRRRRQAGGDVAGQTSGHSPGAGSTPRLVSVSESSSSRGVETEAIRHEGRFRRFVGMVQRRWGWVVLAVAVCGVAGMVIGYGTSRYSVSLTLVQRDTGGVVERGSEVDSFKPRKFSAATMVQLMVSPELARRVAALAIPPVSERQLRASVRANGTADQELVELGLLGSRPVELVNLLNLYANQAVALTREVQLEDCTQLNLFLKGKLRETEAELERVNSELRTFQVNERTTDPEAQTKVLVTQLGEAMTRLENARLEAELLDLQSDDTQRGEQARQIVILERLNETREKLRDKLTRYTEAHPEVIALNAEVTELERQLAGTSTNAAPGGVASLAKVQLIELKARKAALANELKKQEDLRDSLQKRITGLSQQGLQYQLIKARQDSLFRNRQFLAERQRAAQLYQENAAGYYRVLSDATLADVDSGGRYWAALAGLLAGMLLGLAGSVGGVCLTESRDGRITTVEDLHRVTGLPVLATLGELGRMNDEEKDRWAFRAWTLINGKLNRAPDRGLVCGFISAQDGEGKSTWIDLLVTAARRRGLQVLKVTARTSASTPLEQGECGEMKAPVSTSTRSNTQPLTSTPQFSSPANLALQLADSKAGSVDVCLPDWVWNLDHRRQWHAALDRWKGVESVVILVELPAAGLIESMLLAENVPQLIWLAASGHAQARETRMHLETLKHARCQMVGAVLNKAP